MNRFDREPNRNVTGIKPSDIPTHPDRPSGLFVAAGVASSPFGDPNINQKLTSTFGPFDSRPGKKLLVPEWLAKQTQPIPIHLVNDFGDDRSTAECEVKIRSVFRRKGLTYEAPHKIQDIEQFDIRDGAYNIYQLVSTSLVDGQPGVFIGVVDPGVGSERRGVVITTEEGYTFVGPDNGLFWPAIHHHGLHIQEAYMIDPDTFKESSVTFHGRDQFSPMGAEIATGTKPWELGGLIQIDPDTLVKYEFQQGQVVEKDGYPNIKLWPQGIPLNEKGERPTHIKITNPKGFDPNWEEEGIICNEAGDSIIIPVVRTFEDVEIGKPLCYVGSSGEGLPEIAIRNGKDNEGAGNRLRVDIGDVLEVEWLYQNQHTFRSGALAPGRELVLGGKR